MLHFASVIADARGCHVRLSRLHFPSELKSSITSYTLPFPALKPTQICLTSGQNALGTNLAPAKDALSNETIPKGAARVLNAARIQEEFRKKRKAEAEGGRPAKKPRPAAEDETKGKGTKLKIMPGESLAHFNRRVEESMRPLVREAVQTSAAAARKARKEEELEKELKKVGKKAGPARSVSPAPVSKKKAGKVPATDDSEDEDAPAAPSGKPEKSRKAGEKDKPKDFATFSTSAPRRLNDVAEAPPELKKLPRGAKASKTADIGVKGSASLREGVLSMAQKAMLEEERERAIKAYRELKKKGALGV